MKEKQDLHGFGEQGAWPHSPATEEQHLCFAGQSHAGELTPKMLLHKL